MRKCKNCLIGEYDHSGSETAHLFEDLQVDGLADCFQGPAFVFKFCPECGHKIDPKKFFKWGKITESWLWKKKLNY